MGFCRDRIPQHTNLTRQGILVKGAVEVDCHRIRNTIQILVIHAKVRFRNLVFLDRRSSMHVKHIGHNRVRYRRLAEINRRIGRSHSIVVFHSNCCRIIEFGISIVTIRLERTHRNRRNAIYKGNSIRNELNFRRSLYTLVNLDSIAFLLTEIILTVHIGLKNRHIQVINGTNPTFFIGTISIGLLPLFLNSSCRIRSRHECQLRQVIADRHDRLATRHLNVKWFDGLGQIAHRNSRIDRIDTRRSYYTFLSRSQGYKLTIGILVEHFHHIAVRKRIHYSRCFLREHF